MVYASTISVLATSTCAFRLTASHRPYSVRLITYPESQAAILHGRDFGAKQFHKYRNVRYIEYTIPLQKLRTCRQFEIARATVKRSMEEDTWNQMFCTFIYNWPQSLQISYVQSLAIETTLTTPVFVEPWAQMR